MPFFGKLICVSAMWLPILLAQSVKPPIAKVPVSDFEQKTAAHSIATLWKREGSWSQASGFGGLWRQ